MQINRLLEGVPWQEQNLGGVRPGKSICIVRYGGFGDMLQMSSVLPWLKEKGWRVTVNTADKGFSIIKNDPHIDEVFIQKTDQVPNNQELTEYWEKMAGLFRRFVQFSGSIEGGLLALPNAKEYHWNTRPRHLAMNKDYFAQMHNIAQVPLPPRPKFYPTAEETTRAAFFMRQHEGAFVIMWALSGSSLHKAWPYTDAVVARLMIDHPNVKIVFVGDEACRLLEFPWQNEARVIKTSGLLNIRETLALSQVVHMVVGPETGVLNCVAFEDIPKVILLSHSSPVNIGGSWKNTEALTPHGVDCYPCHKLHYGWKSCFRDDETGAALCAANISGVRVYEAIAKHIR